MAQWAAELQRGQRVLFFQDECHFQWGDSCGYVWGPKGERIEVPMTNAKQKQTYYGVINYLTAEVLLKAYPTGNSEATIAFLKFLLATYPKQRLGLIWDGASYHKSQQLQEFLAEVNHDLPPEQWKITCFLLAPHAPEQNPMEDVWLHGKSFVRQQYYRCKTFKDVKELFVERLNSAVLDFPKLQDYRQALQIN